MKLILNIGSLGIQLAELRNKLKKKQLPVIWVQTQRKCTVLLAFQATDKNEIDVNSVDVTSSFERGWRFARLSLH